MLFLMTHLKVSQILVVVHVEPVRVGYVATPSGLNSSYIASGRSYKGAGARGGEGAAGTSSTVLVRTVHTNNGIENR